MTDRNNGTSVSDEPIYCTVCGLEWGDCAHPLPGDDGYVQGDHCEVCSVIPAPGLECWTTGAPCKTTGERDGR
jgi:hypothetical protein